MKKLKAKHYFILFAICVAVVTSVVALTLGKDLAISVLLTGVIGLVGFIIGNFVGKKSAAVILVKVKLPKVLFSVLKTSLTY